MFRAILAAIKPLHAHHYVLDFAYSLAERYKLVLDVCSVIDVARLAPAEPVPIGGSAFKAHRDEQFISNARQSVADMIARIQADAPARGISYAGQSLEGDTVDLIGQAARRSDALICGHTPGGDASERSLVHAILKGTPRPTIVVPHSEFPKKANVLVAYDGSAQAARALAAFAGSGLADGKTIHVATFGSPEQAALHCETAATFLSHHGIVAELHVRPLDQNAGSRILDEARQIEAGLIVMGAFGQGAVHEFLFGSTTRSILAQLPVPVFLDH